MIATEFFKKMIVQGVNFTRVEAEYYERNTLMPTYSKQITLAMSMAGREDWAQGSFSSKFDFSESSRIGKAKVARILRKRDKFGLKTVVVITCLKGSLF